MYQISLSLTYKNIKIKLFRSKLFIVNKQEMVEYTLTNSKRLFIYIFYPFY